MAARTTIASVRGVLNRDYDGSANLQPYIDTATLVIDRAKELATAEDVTLSSAVLEMMERWLAAHFYCQSDKPYQSRNTKGASASFAGKTGMYFESTLYGQTAMRIDPSGSLQSIGGKERKILTAAWLGEEDTAGT